MFFAIRVVISIHALRVEGDPAATPISFNMYAFLSTPSGWRATDNMLFGYSQFIEFLSTPSGWRATVLNYLPYASYIFLSTPSGWRATLHL